MDLSISGFGGCNVRGIPDSGVELREEIATIRRNDENCLNSSWDLIVGWVDDTKSAEAMACLSALYANITPEIEKLSQFARLAELVAEAYRGNFEISSGCCAINTDTGTQLLFEMSTETSCVLCELCHWAVEHDETAVGALRRALSQTEAVAQMVEAAWQKCATEINLIGYPLAFVIPALPNSLTELEIPEARLLRYLPELPKSLTCFTLRRNNLMTALPDLPAPLEGLIISNCTVVSEIPELPSGLVLLYAEHCDALQNLPALPARSFKYLSVIGCRSLSFLPDLPDSLEDLDLYQSFLNLDVSQLPERVAVYRDALGVCHYPPRRHFGMSNVVEVWCMDAGKPPEDVEKFTIAWSALTTEHFYPCFESLLLRLLELRHVIAATEVMEVMEEALRSSVARESIFEEARTSDQDCQDRPLIIFNTVQSLARLSKLQREGAPVREVFKLAEGLWRMALVDESTVHVMFNQWREQRRTGDLHNNGPNLSEALEVQLELRRLLTPDLKLPFQAHSLYSRGIARITPDDRRFALSYVTERTNDVELKCHGLLALPMWRSFIETSCQARIQEVADVYAKLQDDLETDCENGRITEANYIDRCNDLARGRQVEIDRIIAEITAALISEFNVPHK